MSYIKIFPTLETQVGLGYIFGKWKPPRRGGGTCGVPAYTLQEKAKFTNTYILLNIFS